MRTEFAVDMSGEKTNIFFTTSKYAATDGTYIGSVVSYEDEECGGEPWADITVCLPDFPTLPNEVVIPTYKLDKSTYAVVKKNLIEEELGEIKHGFATSTHVRLKANWRDLVEEL